MFEGKNVNWMESQLGQFTWLLCHWWYLNLHWSFWSYEDLTTASLSYFLWLKVPFKFLVYSLTLWWNVVFTISHAIRFQIYLLFYLLDCENTPHLMRCHTDWIQLGLPFLTEGWAFYNWKSFSQTLWSELGKVFWVFCTVNTWLEIFRRFSSHIIKEHSFIILIFVQ